MVRLLAWDEAGDGISKFRKREVRALMEEISWDGEVIPVDFFGGCMVVDVFGSGPKPKEDPGQLQFPLLRGTSGHQGGFQASMESFHDSIGFGIVGGSSCCGDTQSLG